MSPYTQPAQARRTGIAASYLTEPAFARSTGPGTGSCFHCEDPTGSSRHNGSNQARRCVIPNRVPQSHTPPACPRQGAWTRCFGRPQDNRQTPIQFAPVQPLFQALYTAIKSPRCPPADNAWLPAATECHCQRCVTHRVKKNMHRVPRLDVDRPGKRAITDNQRLCKPRLSPPY